MSAMLLKADVDQSDSYVRSGPTRPPARRFLNPLLIGAPVSYRSAISQARRSSRVSHSQQTGRFTSSRRWPVSVAAPGRSAAWDENMPELMARAPMTEYAIAAQKVRLLRFMMGTPSAKQMDKQFAEPPD